MAKKTKKVTILIPCYNEEEGIGAVIDGFLNGILLARGYDVSLTVIDNNSQDRTGEVARAHGAQVVFESKKGKGNAMRSGFASVADDADYVVMIDGDDTYRPKEVVRLLELLEANFCSVVLGSRLYGHMSDGSMKRFNLLGNRLFSFLVRTLYHVPVTDVLTGYYAWDSKAVRRLLPHLTSEGFTIEIEMVTKMAKLGESVCSTPISYDARAGASNLKPVSDGIKIMYVLVSNLFWRPVPVQKTVGYQNEVSSLVA